MRTAAAYRLTQTPYDVGPPSSRNYPTHLHLQDEDRQDLERWLRARGLDKRPLLLLQPGSKKTLNGRRYDPATVCSRCRSGLGP
jgi:hypothetical protein